MRIVHDWLGPIELPEAPERIVSLAPNATDTLFALGLGQRLVGRSAFCYRPAGVLGLPVVSSYTRVRWELLASLEPDLVLVSTGVQRELLQALVERGFPVYPLPLPQSPYGIMENAVLLGALLGVPEAATQLAQGLAERYARLYRALPSRRVYLELDLGGPITVGRGSYVDEALRHLGLQNIFSQHPQSYFAPELAEVPCRAPELFIYEPKPHRSRARERAEQLMAERGWALPLVVTGGDELAHYGPLFFGYLERLVGQIRGVLD
ncbi:MAG: helical backbone metal receptor [Meiothermus sp.]|uniref:helical backbone metal receptor n=1 Tax=Meiothermus sp. TaxID=1955249 RepID=UPI0025F91DEC|nr:helical backbone metal receptor [Meiothermus sp.]MCS7057964.1 helical backbone metal receptor [Meiothermus sp.]MCS7193690.1 helical backbone metal receptor [Meiothermus sp.]MDW8091328.1 helical backbone metal receptor [Meiothermus sp.]MDW8481622.1 helical backbone metal receptor [Meiothermus sp.]